MTHRPRIYQTEVRQLQFSTQLQCNFIERLQCSHASLSRLGRRIHLDFSSANRVVADLLLRGSALCPRHRFTTVPALRFLGAATCHEMWGKTVNTEEKCSLALLTADRNLNNSSRPVQVPLLTFSKTFRLKEIHKNVRAPPTTTASSER